MLFKSIPLMERSGFFDIEIIANLFGFEIFVVFIFDRGSRLR